MNSGEQKIFIVDDDDDVRIALSRSLGKRGMDVEHFPDADTFLSRIDNTTEGCLILDYGMPGMDGLELQDHLIRNDFTIPIIFITGHGGIPESVRATKAGAIDFLEKPFDLQVLIERINIARDVGLELKSSKAKRLGLSKKRRMLTDREEEVLDVILANPSKSSSKEIASELGISPRTVDIHRGRIQQKVGAISTIDLLRLFGKI